jgi:hypothetical protein
MAKRATGVGKGKQTRSHKTAKRLAIKHEMLAARDEKKIANIRKSSTASKAEVASRKGKAKATPKKAPAKVEA